VAEMPRRNRGQKALIAQQAQRHHAILPVVLAACSSGASFASITLSMPLGGIGLIAWERRKERLVTMMDETTKKKVLARLRKIAGQVGGIARMVEQDRYCVDVLLQLASAQAALGEAGKVVLRSHVETCVSAALGAGQPVERKQKIDELMQVFARYGSMGMR